MELNLQHLDSGTLKTLYDREVEALHARLLSGASWSETEEQRRYVTELSIALGHHSGAPSGRPSERRSRNNSPDGQNAP